MNINDIFNTLFENFQNFEEILSQLNKKTNSKEKNHESVQYYEEILRLLDFEILELNLALNNKLKQKREFEKKLNDLKFKQNFHQQKQRQKKQHEESYSSGNFNSKKRTTNYEEKITKYYANLEIPNGSNFETVKKAYRTLLKKYHPDFFHHDKEKQKTATLLTQKLTEAYEALEKHLKNK